MSSDTIVKTQGTANSRVKWGKHTGKQRKLRIAMFRTAARQSAKKRNFCFLQLVKKDEKLIDSWPNLLEPKRPGTDWSILTDGKNTCRMLGYASFTRLCSGYRNMKFDSMNREWQTSDLALATCCD